MKVNKSKFVEFDNTDYRIDKFDIKINNDVITFRKPSRTSNWKVNLINNEWNTYHELYKLEFDNELTPKDIYNKLKNQYEEVSEPYNFFIGIG